MTNKKCSCLHGIWYPTVPRVKKDRKNVQAVVTKQIIEFLDNIKHLLFDQLQHPRNIHTTISKCIQGQRKQCKCGQANSQKGSPGGLPEKKIEDAYFSAWRETSRVQEW